MQTIVKSGKCVISRRSINPNLKIFHKPMFKTTFLQLQIYGFLS